MNVVNATEQGERGGGCCGRRTVCGSSSSSSSSGHGLGPTSINCGKEVEDESSGPVVTL